MTATVRALYEYRSPDDDQPLGTRYFCAACSTDLGGNHGHNYCGWPKTVFDVIAENEGSRERFGRHEGPLSYYRFCPWCGAGFADEWWKHGNTIVENVRIVDHFKGRPGWHIGDAHEWVGTIQDHWLSISGGHVLCWCDPTVEVRVDGCVIRHTALDYETYLAVRLAEPTVGDDDDSCDYANDN